MIETDIFAVSS